MKILALLTLSIALSVSVCARADAWPELPTPPKADAQWVAQSMRVNGIPTRVLQFQSRLSRADVVAYYRAYWSGGYEHAPSIHQMGKTTVVGQVHGPYLMTLKVQDAADGASTGLLSVAQVIGSTPDHGAGELSMLGGAHVMSVVESDDPGKHSRQVIIIAPQDADTAIQFYQTSLTNDGWKPLQSNDLTQTGGPRGTFMAFSDGDREMQMQIVARGRHGTLVLANLVTKDTESGGN